MTLPEKNEPKRSKIAASASVDTGGVDRIHARNLRISYAEGLSDRIVMFQNDSCERYSHTLNLYIELLYNTVIFLEIQYGRKFTCLSRHVLDWVW